MSGAAYHFDLPVVAFAADRQSRTIAGTVLPYKRVAANGGLKFRFNRGSLRWADVGRVKLLRDHDRTQAIGRAAQLLDTAGGLTARFSVASGAAGDEALTLASEGVLDGFSVGVDFDLAADTVPDPQDPSVTLVRRADLREVSLTAMPAFDDARVSTVVASRNGVSAMDDDTTTTAEPTTQGAPAAATFAAGTLGTPAPAATGYTLTNEQLAAMLGTPAGREVLLGLAAPPAQPEPEPPRQIVDPTTPRGFSGLSVSDRPVGDYGPRPLLPSREAVTAMMAAMRDGRSTQFTTDPESMHQFATVTTTVVGTPVAPLMRAVAEPRRLSLAARIPREPFAGVTNAQFPIFGAGSAEIAAEGAAKQEYAAITLGTAIPQMIAVWTDWTRQIEMSEASFEQRLRSKLAALVAIREDKMLIANVLALVLPTFAKAAGVARSDALLQAAATIVAATGAEPNLAVVNTADLPGIFTGSAGAGGETPEAELRLQVRGMTIYPSNDIATGTALVGAWPAGSSFIEGLPPTYLTDAVSGIKNNKITTLLEEACNIAVDDLNAFVKITTFTS